MIHYKDTGRTDYQMEINDHQYRVSFLSVIQTIVYTNITLGVGDEIKLDRPFASKTPHESLVRNEVVNHLDHLGLLEDVA